MEHNIFLKSGFTSVERDVQHNRGQVDWPYSVITELRDRFKVGIDVSEPAHIERTTIADDLSPIVIRGGASKLNDSATENEDQQSVEGFAKLPFAVYSLMEHATRAGASPTYFCGVLNCIARLWSGWRLDEESLEFEYLNGVAHLLVTGGNGIAFAAHYVAKSDDSNQKKHQVAVERMLIDDPNVGEWLCDFFLKLSLCSDYLVRAHGMCWPCNVALGGSEKCALEGQGDGETSGSHALVVMERMACKLGNALSEGWVKTREHRFDVLYDVCKALMYLHERRMVHGDLKPENVLVNISENKIVGFAKVANFGCSRRSHDIRSSQTFTGQSFSVETTLYIPPEVLEQPGKYCIKESWDVWSYGVLICFLLLPPELWRWSLANIPTLSGSKTLATTLQKAASRIDEKLLRAIALRCLSLN